MPYGLPEALHEVSTAKEGYIAVTGTISFNERKLPKTDWDNQEATPNLTQIKARIKGKVLSQAGFTNAFNKSLTMELRCFGPWCSSARSDQQVLAFLKQSSDGYSLSITPCGGHLFEAPTKVDLKSVTQCYLRNDCPPTNRP